MSAPRTGLRHYLVALRAMLVLTVALGVGYPLLVTVVGQVALAAQANGSLVRTPSGETVGSALIGQSFTDKQGKPLPRYFQSRPSAAGDGYDGTASGGSNLGPNNPKLAATIAQRRTEVAAFNGVSPAAVPPDAVTASASGLDPDISPAYALLQVHRIATARQLPEQTVRDIVEQHVASRDLGVLGEERVNVLQLNIALDGLKG